MTKDESSTPKRGRWLKWLLWAVGGLAVLVVALYFVVTSEAFLKSVILPKVGQSLNADVTVSDAEISPFSQVVLHDVKVVVKGTEPVFTATSVTARYDLRAILGGHIVVDEAAIVSPTVTVIENADGTSNLPQPASAEKPKAEAKPAAGSQPSAPPSVDIKSVHLDNATIRYVKNLKDGTRQTIELTQVNFTVSNIQNGGTAKLTFGANLVANQPGSVLQAKAAAEFTVAFDQKMQPGAITGSKTFTVEQATGEFAALAEMGVKFDCDLVVDQAAQAATVKTLRLVGTQKQHPLLQMELSEPMTVAWGTKHEQVPDATLNFTVTNLNLADWKALAGAALPSGVANLKLKVVSAQAGQQLNFDLDGQVANLAANGLPAVDVRLQAKGQVQNLQQFNLSDYRVDVTQKNHTLIAVAGTGKFDRPTGTADAQVTVKATLDRLATMLGQTNFTCRAGQLELTSHVTSTPKSQTVTGQLTLADFTARYADYVFDNLGATFDLDVAMTGKEINIRKAAGQLRGGGKLDVTGQFDGDKKAGQFAVKLADFHETDLRPFLQPSLGANKLVSISLNTTATAEFDATGAAAVKADLNVANLVVQNPTNSVPAPVLQVGLKLDAAAKKSVLTLNQCQLALKPTARANNELNLTGTVDYGRSNAITGNLKLAAAALDLTAYYDLLAGTNQTQAAQPAPPSAAAQPATQPNGVVAANEPAAMTLPFHDFTLAVAIDRLYLRAVDIANFQTTAKLDGGHVVVKPLELTLNGGPIKSTLDLDLGVPGYKYDIAFAADKIPLAPLVDSFSPTYRDSANGMLSANIQLKGAGTTGRSLREHLTGKVTVAVNDAKIEIVGPKAKSILGPISFALGAPEVLSSPLNYIDCDLTAGDGKIEMNKFTARSTAVLVESHGTIPIADVLTDSPLDLPVDLSLSHQLAMRFHPNTPAAEGYAKWPTLVRLSGTVGNPTTKMALGDTVKDALGTAAGAVKGTFGQLFGGSDSSATNSTTSTNSSSGILDFFHHKKEQ